MKQATSLAQESTNPGSAHSTHGGFVDNSCLQRSPESSDLIMI